MTQQSEFAAKAERLSLGLEETPELWQALTHPNDRPAIVRLLLVAAAPARSALPT